MAVKVSGVEVIDNSRNITTNVGTVDGRDIAADGTKLDGIEAGADVTDAANVEPLIDAHLNYSTATSGQVLSYNGTDYDWVDAGGTGTVSSVAATVPTGFTVSGSPITASGTLAIAYDTGYQGFTTAESTKLSGIEAGADVTDAGNVNPLVDSHLNTSTATTGQVLSWTGTDYDWVTDEGGTVTSVAATVPTGFSISGSPITASGTLAITYSAGYQGYTTTESSKLSGIEAGADVTDAANVEPLVDSHLNTSTATTGQYLGWNGADYAWSTVSGYTDADVDTHLNTGTATTGEVLSWTGSDYDWVAVTVPDISITTNSVAVGPSADNWSNGVTIGLSAGTSATSSGGVAIGKEAGRYAGGQRSIGIGEEALRSSLLGSSGTYNIGIGYQTGYDLSTGTHNFLGGYQAGTNLTTGSNNVAIGQGALDAATTGGRNIAIGQDAMGLGVATNTTGDNVAIGYQSGFDLTLGIGNVLIGRTSGSNITTGFNNTLVGRNSGNTLTTGENNTVLGSNAEASSATVSNEITLGNTSITRFRIPGAGIDNTSDALSGTTPSVDVGARDTYTLTTSGNTTFTFTGAPSSGQVGSFSLIITAGGTHTLTWPASVDWAGGTAPAAPASGETDIYTFMSIDGGTTWYGFLAGDAMA